MATEEPVHEVIAHDGAFELRRYPPRVVAETAVDGAWSEAGNQGFRRLAGYIFGGNRGRTKLAMTAPVGVRPGVQLAMTAPVAQRPAPSAPGGASDAGDGWLVTFTMPKGETLASLPVPVDARVVLRELPPTEVAVVKFSGRWTDDNMAQRTAALRKWVAARGLTVTSEPEVNRYDPPFKPWFLRRNEVWLEVTASA